MITKTVWIVIGGIGLSFGGALAQAQPAAKASAAASEFPTDKPAPPPPPKPPTHKPTDKPKPGAPPAPVVAPVVPPVVAPVVPPVVAPVVAPIVAPAPPPCLPNGKNAALVSAIASLHRARDAAAAGCSDALTACVDGLGLPILGEQFPKLVDVGDTINVVSLFPSYDSLGRVGVSSQARHSLDQVLRTNAPVAPPAGLAAVAAVPVGCDLLPPADIAALHSTLNMLTQSELIALTPPTQPSSAPDWQAVIDALNKATYSAQPAIAITVPSADWIVIQTQRAADSFKPSYQTNSQKIYINHGRYYVDIGVLLPIIPNGSRSYYLATVPGTDERQVRLENDWRLSSAVSLNIYPFGGRANDVPFFWNDGEGWDHLRGLFGLQLATSLTTPAKEWYTGLLVEPISGVALSGGFAFVKGQFLGGTLSNKTYLPAGDGLATRDLTMVRFYFGLTTSLELMDTLYKASKSIQTP